MLILVNYLNKSLNRYNNMARLQFRHKTNAFDNRELAVQYIENVVNKNHSVDNIELAKAFSGSVIAEPIAVKYKDEEGKEQVILAIGVQDGGDVPYHIIDTAKLEEDITVLSGLTQEMQEQIQGVLDSIDTINDSIDSIESSITEMQDSIDELDENVVKRIEINNDDKWFSGSGKPIVVEPEDNVAKIELTSDSVRIDNYHGQLVHHGHSLTEFISAVEGIKFQKIEEPLEASVKEAYKLVDGDGHQMGNTIIKIYKDSAYKEIYLGTSADTVDRTTGEITKLDGDKEFLNYVYMLSDGTYEIVKINLEQFLIESEFGNGLNVNSHLVSVKIDDNSEDFLTVGPDGILLSGIQDAINTAKLEEQQRAEDAEQDLQDELDATQVGAGLAEDGSYIHDHPTTYIDEATSLADADHRLDSALKTVEDKVDNLSASTESFISETNNKISELETSTSDLENKITELSAATTSEIERATNKENEIATNLATETSEREEADAILTNVVSNEINRATARENEIESALTQEIADRQAADAALSDRIDEIEDNIVVGENAIDVTVADDVAKVTLKISAADNVLTQDVNGLKANLSVAIVKEDDVEYIVLRGKDDIELSKVNANKFVKDGMLDRAYLENNNLVLIFNTDSGKEPIIIPLSGLIPVYTAGTYLTLENNVFDARVGQGGLATNESVTILSGRVENTISQLYGTYQQDGSIRHIIEDTFSNPLTHTPMGTQEEADNNNLLRYYKPEGSADGDIRYYVSNKTSAMVHGDENLADVIDGLIDGLAQETAERISGDTALWEALSAETQARQEADEELWDALSAETADRIIADEELWDALSAETVARQEADGELQNNIDAEEERAIAEEQALWEALSAETADRLSGDTVLSEKIEELENSQDDLIEKIEALSGITSNDLIADAEYVVGDSAHTIVFYNRLGENIAEIDADAFIKDGMVEDVYYSGGTLYIVFNTDSGKETIEIPLGDIFNPEDYYTKYECDDLFLTREVFSNKELVIAAAFNDLNDRIDDVEDIISGDVSDLIVKINQLSASTVNAINELSGNVADNYYTKDESDDLFLTKQKYEEDELVVAAAFNDLRDKISEKPDKDDVYTKQEVDTLINNLLENISSTLSTLLVGTDRQIKITKVGDKLQIGFADDAIFGD